MPGPWEDYGKSPQPQSGPWQDYGSAATIEPSENKEKSALDYAGSFATGLIPDTAKGIYNTVVSAFPHPDISAENAKRTKELVDKGDYWGAAKHVVAKAVEATPGGSIITGAVHNAIDEVHNAAKFYDAGDKATAANHLSRALPVIGPMIGGLADVGGDKQEIKDKQGNVIQEASQGDPARMLGQIAGMALAPKAIEGVAKIPGGVKTAAKATRDFVKNPANLKTAAGVTGVVGGIGAVGSGLMTGSPYEVGAGLYGTMRGMNYLSEAAKLREAQAAEGAVNAKTPAPPPQEPYASPGGIPTGPNLSGGGTPAEILAADLARRRAAKANANVPTPPSAPTPPDEVNGVPVGAAESLPVSPSRQLNAGPVVHAMPPAADTSGVIKGWQPTILENENAPVPQPVAPVAAPPPPDPFEPSKADLDGAAQGLGNKDFDAFYKKYPQAAQRLRDVIYKSNAKKAAAAAPQAEVAPEANAGAQPEASVVAEAQSRRLEKDRQQFLQALKDERANQESAPEVAPEPAQPEPVSTPEPEVAPPPAPEPQEQPAPEPAAPIQPEVAPVKNPVSGQAHPIPKDFGANELSDMPVRSGHAQIRSSTVHSVGYDPETGHPEIHFKKPFPNGGLYRYPNLPQEELLRAVQEAPSFGAWTREVLRANPEWTKGYQKISTEENPPLLGGQQAAAPAQAPSLAENVPSIAAQSAENPVGKNPEGVPDNPHPKAVYTVPTSHLQVDAPRFQYKAGMGKGGAGDALRGVQKYDTQQGGVLSVWRDPANGKDYIVNGHHRLELAQRAGEPNVRVQYIDAPTAADARLKGAILNIGEGQGTAIDAAKVFRDGGIGPDELGKYGIALTAAKAKAGMALANLDPHLFSKVVNGEFPIERAQIIGEGVNGMEDQRALYDLIKKRESSGKSMTDGQISEMIRLQSEAPRVEESQESLFGTQEMSRSLLPEKAEVSSYVRQQLSEEKKLFKAVANGSAAEKLGAAGNVIKAEENAKVAITAAQAQAIYDKLSTSAGAINTALDEAAQAIAKGSNATNAKTIAYQKIKSELFKQAKSLAGEN